MVIMCEKMFRFAMNPVLVVVPVALVIVGMLVAVYTPVGKLVVATSEVIPDADSPPDVHADLVVGMGEY